MDRNGENGPSVDPPALLSEGRSWRLAGLVVNGVGQAAAAVGAALLVEAAFNGLLEGGRAGSIGSLAPFGAALVVAALVLGALRARERSDAERLGQSYVHSLRNTMYKRLSRLAPRALQTRSQGAIVLRFVGDLTAIGRWVSLGLSRAIVGGTFVLGVLGALFFISIAIAGAVAAVLLLGAAAAFVSGRTLRTRARKARRRRTRLASNVNEKVATLGVMQVFGQTQRERRHLNRQSKDLRRAMIAKAEIVGRLRGLAEATSLIASAAVLMVGAIEVGAGRATPGTIVAAMALVGLLANPLRDLGRVNEYWHNYRISMEKVHSFLRTRNLVRELPGAPPLKPGPGRLEFRGVSVEGSLEGVDAVVEPGSVVAVVGPNGSGKSTLLTLAARLFDPDEGTVCLDGQDVSLHRTSSVRAALSMAAPDLPLLRGTVEENLRYRWPDAPPDELARVVADCSLERLLAELPEGIETRVVEGGRNLSAGQRQRISLARALVGDPKVLLLDEADANLDREARALIDRVIRTRGGKRTVLVVSHRPEVLVWADQVWRLDDGRLEVDPSEPNGQDDAPVSPRRLPTT